LSLGFFRIFYLFFHVEINLRKILQKNKLNIEILKK